MINSVRSIFLLWSFSYFAFVCIVYALVLITTTLGREILVQFIHLSTHSFGRKPFVLF